MEPRRTYGDGCAIAHGLDLVGDRWALLVVRELLLGPKRFTDLKSGLPNASPNVIAERLRELERTGVVRRVKLPPPANARVYELTEWGRELEQTVLALGRWAVRSPSQPAGVPVGLDSVVLALKTLFDADAADGLRASYELRIGEHSFVIEVSEGQIDVARGSADQPGATIETDLDSLSAVIWGGRSLADAQRAGQMRIGGDEAAVKRLVGLFPIPEPATAAAAR
jgi:DNA-binding HxlR family transcriptional regulator/putative sterol carrier protein